MEDWDLQRGETSPTMSIIPIDITLDAWRFDGNLKALAQSLEAKWQLWRQGEVWDED